MFKKIMLLIVITIALWFVYSNFLVPYLSTFKDKKFDTYYTLKENKVESENYKIRKLDIKMHKIESIQYDKITANYIITSKAKARSLWKINKYGVLIDSLVGEEGKGKKVLVSPNSLGIVFRAHFYSDWAISGNKKEYTYSQVINYDSLSTSQFNTYILKASLIYAKQHNYYNVIKDNALPDYIKMGQCFLYINNEWIVIQSEKLYKDFDNANENKLKALNDKLSKKQSRFVYHKTETVGIHSSNYDEGPAFLYYNEHPPIELQHFTKQSRSRKALFSFNPTGSRSRSGWEGIGYFEWNYKSDKLHFKTDAFDSFNYYDLNIEISTVDEQKKGGLAFIYKRTGGVSSELYVVSPKKAEQPN